MSKSFIEIMKKKFNEGRFEDAFLKCAALLSAPETSLEALEEIVSSYLEKIIDGVAQIKKEEKEMEKTYPESDGPHPRPCPCPCLRSRSR